MKVKNSPTGLSRRERRILNNFEWKYKEMFIFFIKSSYYNILDFSGTYLPNIIFDINGDSSIISYVKYNNGEYDNNTIITKHPNLTRLFILGKKSWGLWMNEWSKGISEGLFTRKEILEQFDKKNIKIPKKLIQDFENTIKKEQINFIYGIS